MQVCLAGKISVRFKPQRAFGLDLSLTGTFCRADEEKEILKEAEEELVGVEERAARLRNQLLHGMLDSTDAAVKIGICYEVSDVDHSQLDLSSSTQP